jgi:CRP-like cAMP-binding protein
MFEKFEKYLLDRTSLTDGELEQIIQHCQQKRLRKKQYLLETGEVWKYDVFVSRGLLKLYFVDDKGLEHILQFAPENHWTGDRESTLSGLPSKLNIDAIEESEVVMILNDDFEMLRRTIPAFNDFVNDTLNKNVLAHQRRIHSSITNSAEEKYNNFLIRFPQIINRIPLHMIASYLGVSAETLSRIRSQAAKK